MSMPQDIADRLQALGEDPAHFNEMLNSEGADFLRGFIERLEDADRLYQQWAPRLREFASECRRALPCPDASELSPRDAAKLPIYESLITNAERLPRRRKNEVLLCSVPLLGIPVAQSLWPGQDERTVLLTPDEISRWHEIYQHPVESFQWFTNYWWWIDDPPSPDCPLVREMRLTHPEGTDPWLVVSGLSWGSMAGGEDGDLWCWDGKKAEFVGNAYDLTF